MLLAVAPGAPAPATALSDNVGEAVVGMGHGRIGWGAGGAGVSGGGAGGVLPECGEPDFQLAVFGAVFFKLRAVATLGQHCQQHDGGDVDSFQKRKILS